MITDTTQTAQIEIDAVCKSYGRTVLNDVSLTCPAGETICLVGPNAVGKTTLLRIVARLTKPDRGHIRLNGSDRSAGFNGLGMIFHQPVCYPQLTVRENLLFFAKLYRFGDASQKVDEQIKYMQLTGCRDEPAAALSRGTLQKLAIARALLADPQILLADEPFANLDTDFCRQLIDVFNTLRARGRTILMTTHQIEYALRCCSRMAVLKDTRLLMNKAVSQIDTELFCRDYLAYAAGAGT